MNQLRDVRLQIIVDNVSLDDALAAEHDFACLVEADGRRVLFDTGAKVALAEKSHRLGVSLFGLDALVLSRGHYGHTGGLALIADRFGTDLTR